MLMKQDTEFGALLDDDTKLEPRLAELIRQRRWNVVAAVALTALVYGLLITIASDYKSSISTTNPFGSNPPAPMVLLPTIFLPLVIIQVAKALNAHSEIRVLLLFRKLSQARRDD
jgi:hypothetical protein